VDIGPDRRSPRRPLARLGKQTIAIVHRPFGLLDVWTFGRFRAAMPTITDTAICIRRWDFSETSQTVSLLTREHGILRGLAKGAKREKGGFSGGLDVLTRGEVVASVKPGRELSIITAWHLQDPFRVVRERLAANRIALYMADLVHHMLVDDDPHPQVFDDFAAALTALDNPAGMDPALLAFQWSLLREAGYKPELNRDARTGAALPNGASAMAFSAAAGGIVSDGGTEAPGTWRVRRETVDLLRRAADGELLKSESPETLRRANRLLAVYLRELIGTEPPAMRWAFSDLGI
jgi:DNA repair protein RecO (recombination protein O)